MIAARVAVSGSPAGCTPTQLTTLRDVLLELVREGTWELHIADTHGVTADAHAFWRACRQRIVTHPSRGDAERAHLDHDETRPSLPLRERTLGLVSQCEALVHVTTPDENYLESGVVGAARRRGLAIIIILPTGCVRQWTHGMAPIMETPA